MVETRPYLDDGTPFPTLYYLTCPSAVAAVGRLEEQGGVEAFRRRAGEDATVARALDALARAYSRRRRELAPPGPHADGGAVLDRGVGGPTAAKATCLHAQAAALLAVTHGRLGEGPAGSIDEVDDPDRPADDADHPAAYRELLAGFGDLWCDDRRCAAFGPPGPVRAAIDVGTNSVRLLVARLGPTGVATLVREAVVTRLGEGLGAGPGTAAVETETGDGEPGARHASGGRPEKAPGGRPRLAPAARRRTEAAVARYVERAREAGAETIRLVGTSACRVAADGREFVAALGERHGVEAAVVSGETEAGLAFAGATLDVSGRVVLVDVGGGSTELVTQVAGTDTPAGLAELRAVSLPVGCVTGTERWFGADPPSPGERQAARREVAGAVAPHRGTYGSSGPTLVGVAGTVTTLACLVLGLPAYDADLIHLRRLSRDRLEAQQELLATLDRRSRAALPCMQAGRAEVIVAGGEILLGVMEALGWEGLVVSERDLLDGIVLAEHLET